MTVMVRPEILRAYHEATYGGVPASAEAFAKASFEEYLALVRITFPGISPRRAAARSSRQEFRHLAETLDDEQASASDPVTNAVVISRQTEVDLREVDLGLAVDTLLLDRIKAVAGWEGLSRAGRLASLAVAVCGGPTARPTSARVDVERLHVASCQSKCLRAVLNSTNARQANIDQASSASLDLSPLREHVALRRLRADALLVRGLDRLHELRLEEAHLFDVDIAQAPAFLDPHRNRLRSLGLGSRKPFGSELLPDLPHLERLTVSGHDEYRDDWIAFATAHPQVACQFIAPPGPPPKSRCVEIAEIYHGVEILRLPASRGRARFEIATDVVDLLFDRDDLDNTDLQDTLSAEASKAGLNADWASEADTLVMQTDDLATCRWVIDRALEHAQRG